MTRSGGLPDLRLDDQLCFALYAASRAMTARYRPRLDAIGLTYPQYLVMMVLWDEGESSVRALGDRLRLDSGTLSPLLRRLEDAGLIGRRRSPRDERSVLVSVTDAGRELQLRAAGVPVDISTSIDEHSLTADLDIADLRTTLRRLETALRETTAEVQAAEARSVRPQG